MYATIYFHSKRITYTLVLYTIFLTKRLYLVSKNFLQFLFRDYQLIIRHSDRFSHIFKRKFNLYTVFLRTKYNPNGTVLVSTTFKTVEQRQIIVHLSCILWFESTDL